MAKSRKPLPANHPVGLKFLRSTSDDAIRSVGTVATMLNSFSATGMAELPRIISHTCHAISIVGSNRHSHNGTRRTASTMSNLRMPNHAPMLKKSNADGKRIRRSGQSAFHGITYRTAKTGRTHQRRPFSKKNNTGTSKHHHQIAQKPQLKSLGHALIAATHAYKEIQ